MTSSGTLPRLTHSDVCISIINGETFDRIRPEPVYAIKIRGGFSNEELAGESAKQIRETDPDHDILIGQLGEWLSLDHRRYCKVNRYEQPILDEIMNPKTRESAASDQPNDQPNDQPSDQPSDHEYEFTIQTLPATDVDNLSVDKVIPNQSVFCFSYITSDQLRNLATKEAKLANDANEINRANGANETVEQPNRIHCFKILGIFATNADAQRFAASVSSESPQDIFMAEVGKWSILDCRSKKTVGSEQLVGTEQPVDSEQAINRLIRFICDERDREKLEFQERLRVENMAK